MTKDTKTPPLAKDVKTHVEKEVAEGRLTPQNWRHAALDIADRFAVDFHLVEDYARRVLKSWVDRGPDEA